MNLPITGYILIALLVAVSSLQATPKHHLSHNAQQSRTGTYGQYYGGQYFQYKVKNTVNLRAVIINHGEVIDGIKLCFDNGKCSNWQGGEGGHRSSWQVPEGQTVQSVLYRMGNGITSLQFVTNTGQTSPNFGGNDGDYGVHTFKGSKIIGFYGRSGERVDQLGFILSTGPIYTGWNRRF